MRILLLADLHSVRSWYEWITAQAQGYDLVSIAGDLVDAFAPDEEGQVAHLLNEWLPTFRQTGVPLAICSGNHDDPTIPWAGNDPARLVVGDGETRLLEVPAGRLVVTTCPNNRWGNDSLMVKLWDDGARLRTAEGCPWLVLHHEPPWELSPSEHPASMWPKVRLSQHHPQFLSCGHFHDIASDGLAFAIKIEGTWCFNAGQDLLAPRPHHIVLDLAAGTATRHWMVPVRGTLSWISRSETLSL